ncbi:mechanosensitive ion channel [Chlorobaculum sp. 24CR]|uniref:mechanosensitive ion channel family protein n=1 Tax=Chlorobaculum sp. 24CR TaxID=2508878 RepID=UPI00100BC2B1|nr:mechanosensitive ion channel domain-containing protein [Chlorobaculum sp. 24CR]RXK82311.1 mechanosensitive ion channel [Chlorobaculum sp. 24CR]
MEPTAYRDISHVTDWLVRPMIVIGHTEISIAKIATILLLVTVIVSAAKFLKRVLVGRLLVSSVHDEGTRSALGTILQYLIVFFGILIVLQSAGIDLSTLTVLSGTIGLGIGFGLQNITDNFFSGLIILLERPVKVGDRIQVGDINGDVVRIAIRSTTILTNDNINIIIPNSEFVSKQVINWSHNDRNLRVAVPVGVSYGSDPEQVRRVLLGVADHHPDILAKPAPVVLFSGFGNSALNFELLVWTETRIQTPRFLQSELNFRIFAAFRKNGIEIPFPQTDLHIRSSDIPLWEPGEPKAPAG